MEIRENNLYRNGFILVFDDGEELLLRDYIKVFKSDGDRYHTVTSIDRIDLLAYEYYKDIVADASKFWWVLADANEILEPLDLSALTGKDIIIPNIINVLLNI